MNSAGFGELISSYGLPVFSITAPLIIAAELAVGLGLVLFWAPRKTALAGLVMLIAFSAAFFYANVIHGVEDCGCFGSLETNLPAWTTYVRNAILIALPAETEQFSENQEG